MAKNIPIYLPVLLTFFTKDNVKLETRTISGYEEAVRIATEETMWNPDITNYTIEELY